MERQKQNNTKLIYFLILQKAFVFLNLNIEQLNPEHVYADAHVIIFTFTAKAV